MKLNNLFQVNEDYSIFSLSNRNLTSLTDLNDALPERVYSLFCNNNNLLIKDIITLSAFDIPGLQNDGPNPFKIIINCIEHHKDVYACHQELVEAGFEEFAQL